MAARKKPEPDEVLEQWLERDLTEAAARGELTVHGYDPDFGARSCAGASSASSPPRSPRLWSEARPSREPRST
jgi:hypothetical protein